MLISRPVRLYFSSFDLGDRARGAAGADRRQRMRARHHLLNALDSRPASPRPLARGPDRQAGRPRLRRARAGPPGSISARPSELEGIATLTRTWSGSTAAMPFILRRAMKQSGFDTLIRNALARNEIVYAGFSAAAVIAFDSLAAGWSWSTSRNDGFPRATTRRSCAERPRARSRMRWLVHFQLGDQSRNPTLVRSAEGA